MQIKEFYMNNDNEQLATIKKPGEVERVSNEEF